jgi:transposase
MFIRVKTKSNGMRSVQLVSNYRRGDKVKQQIIRHIGQGKTDAEIDALKAIGEFIRIQTLQERQPVLPLYAPEDVYQKSKALPDSSNVSLGALRSRQHLVDGISDVFGALYDELGWNRLLKGTKKDQTWNRILRAMVLARIANPSSKKKSQHWLARDMGIKIPLDRVYRMMDHVAAQKSTLQERVGQQTFTLFEEAIEIAFFDVTTLYFESFEEGTLQKRGYSKDAKFNEMQVVLALLVTQEGLPLGYEVFEGSTFEGHTLLEVLARYRERFRVGRVVVVADRGLFNNDNRLAMEAAGIAYVVGAKLRTLSKTMQTLILESNQFRGTDVDGHLYWVNTFGYRGRRLIVSYSQDRAKRDSDHRRKQVERLLKKSKEGTLPIASLIGNHGTKKYIQVDKGTAHIDDAKIARDAEWDGLHGIVTNIETQNPAQLLLHYRGLWQIEEAFRINKHDLRIRPIFHFTQQRIEAHLAICYLAYALSKHALHRLKVQAQSLSLARLRDELLQVSSHIVEDIATGQRFCIPSGLQATQKKIYQIFGLKRKEAPYAIVGSR